MVLSYPVLLFSIPTRVGDTGTRLFKDIIETTPPRLSKKERRNARPTLARQLSQTTSFHPERKNIVTVLSTLAIPISLISFRPSPPSTDTLKQTLPKNIASGVPRLSTEKKTVQISRFRGRTLVIT